MESVLVLTHGGDSPWRSESHQEGVPAALFSASRPGNCGLGRGANHRGRRRRWLGSRYPAVLLPCERVGNKEGWALCLLMTTFCSWSGKQDWAAVVI